MIEKHFILEGADPVIFYGAGNANIRMLRALCPKLRLMARDNVVRAVGGEEDVEAFGKLFATLERLCTKYNRLTEEDIAHAVRGKMEEHDAVSDVIVYSTGGRPIVPRSENQRRLVEAYGRSDMIFAIGPAGSGKTYTAIALAVRALKNKEVKKIILSRPAVEAGEKLGFLPGDMKDKIDPYLQPLYDALQEMIPAARLQDFIANGVIQIAPLAFMRGRTLNDAVVILDEAQNTTTAQIKMFLTRMGHGAKMIVTGDRTQIDLPASQRSGLIEAQRILSGIPGISFIETDGKDIIRHRLVTRIVEAYAREDARRRKQKEAETKAGTGE